MLSNYFDELCKSMEWLADKNTHFIGQGVKDGGTFMSSTFKNISEEKKVEFPVAEQFQFGISIGWAIAGHMCVSVFPRHNFLLLAMSEMVNLLDNFPELTKSDYMPKLIIRTAVGTTKPIYPGVQHAGNFTEAFKKLLKNIKIVELTAADQIFPAYQDAYERNGTTLITEFGDLYYA